MGENRCLALHGSLTQQVRVLWRRQCSQWPMLRDGLASLQSARTRCFEVCGSQVVAQCNPARVRSAAAKVDPEALRARPCFLCEANLPPEQRAVEYARDWLILCNPMPIFDPHFVVATRRHEPQRLRSSVGALLSLARELEGGFTVFYNGPLCGASAPDHLHLQVSPAGAMPFENELAARLCAEHHSTNHRSIEWLWSGDVHLGLSRFGCRPVVVMMGTEVPPLTAAVDRALDAIAAIHPAEPEPMVNLFATFNDQRWLVWFFPRRAHRPSCYGQGPSDFLISPGAADLGGVLIVPRREDFERIDAATIQTIYEEILFTSEQWAALRRRLRG